MGSTQSTWGKLTVTKRRHMRLCLPPKTLLSGARRLESPHCTSSYVLLAAIAHSRTRCAVRAACSCTIRDEDWSHRGCHPHSHRLHSPQGWSSWSTSVIMLCFRLFFTSFHTHNLGYALRSWSLL